MESNRRNYYRILHVQPDAPEAVIRASYRTIMQRLKAHPDLGGDTRGAALLNEACAVLTDPARRAAYDAGLRPRYARAGGPADSPAPTPDGRQRRTAAECRFCGRPEARVLQADTLCTGCGSPLYPAERQDAGAGGRALPRLARSGAAWLCTQWPQPQPLPAEIRDLSPSGVRLVTAAALTEGSVVKLDSDVCRAVLHITRARRDAVDGRCSAGGAFLTVLFSQPRGGFVSTRA